LWRRVIEEFAAWVLARLFIATDWTAPAMEAVVLEALGRKTAPKWLSRLVAEVLAQSPTPYAPSPCTLEKIILASPQLHGLRLYARDNPLFEEVSIGSAPFAPVSAFRDTDIPAMEVIGDVASWLNLPMRQLEWLADVEGYRVGSTSEATRHYRYAWVPKRSGPPRLIEAPKPLLKGIQRKILREILDKVAVHGAAHAYCRGRSCLTAAQLHAGEDVVVTMDLKDFFPSIPMRSVHGLFRCLGYPWEMARILGALCSTATPADVFERLPAESRPDYETALLLRQGHLPQGAPTSPALANLCAWRLDCRLDGLARRLGARYTRYADDLAFSGDRDLAREIRRFLPLVVAICADAGFAVNHHKTRIMGQGGRQCLTGLSINRHVNVPRDTYDRLKAIVYNCVRHGPAGQNRDGLADFRAHLDGRISWVESVNRVRGDRLRLLFERIDWS